MSHSVYVQNNIVSFALSKRIILVACILVLLLLIASSAALALGDVFVPFGQIFGHLLDDEFTAEGFVLKSIRAPRLVCGVFVGAALGFAGAVFQSLTRNALASPDIIGMNAGAAVGAVFAVVFLGVTTPLLAPLAVLGSLAATVLVFGLSWRNGIHPNRLVLIGIGLSFFLYAIVNFLITRSSMFRVSQVTQWLSGSLNSRGWDDAGLAAFAFLIAVVPAVFLQRQLNQIELGDELAQGLGIRVSLLRLIYGGIAVVMSALSVAVAGPVAFVAFVSGPLARRISRAPGSNLLLASLVGANLTVIADLLSRQLFSPIQLPVGIFTAAVGAPYLLWLLSRMISKGKI